MPLIIAIVITLVVFGVDIGSKYYFDGFLGSEPVPFLPGFIRFIKVHNTGAGYGIFWRQDDIFNTFNYRFDWGIYRLLHYKVCKK